MGNIFHLSGTSCTGCASAQQSWQVTATGCPWGGGGCSSSPYTGGTWPRLLSTVPWRRWGGRGTPSRLWGGWAYHSESQWPANENSLSDLAEFLNSSQVRFLRPLPASKLSFYLNLSYGCEFWYKYCWNVLENQKSFHHFQAVGWVGLPFTKPIMTI